MHSPPLDATKGFTAAANLGYRAAVDVSRELNPAQKEAVLHRGAPLLVLAGAGSGKTRVITYRIALLIQEGLSPHRLLAVTFTNKAAGEMRERVERLVGEPARRMWIGTFHAICARLLRQHGAPVGLTPSYVIYDEDDQRALMRQVFEELKVPERLFAPREILWRIDRAKNDGIGPDRFEARDYLDDMVAKAYAVYQRRLAAANAVDFGDILLKTLELLRADEELADHLAERFEHLLVDEFQDTNRVQYELVRRLSRRHDHLCVVGDDDQSIYGWRGAKIRNLLDFERDHPNAALVKLEQNYRSTQIILDAAAAIIARNTERKGKTLWTDRAAGPPILLCECDDERAEASFVVRRILELREREQLTFGDVALFYRTHAQSRVLEEALRSAHPPIPYVVVGGLRFYDRAEIKDLLAYLKVLANPADEVSLLRIINVPTRGIGESTIHRVAELARASGLSFWEMAKQAAADEGHGRGQLKAGPRHKLASFCELLAELTTQAEHLSPSQLAELVLERSGYAERLAIDGSTEARARAENLMELVTSLKDYEAEAETPTLVEFLERVSLASDVDGYTEGEGRLTLMTVHSAKGLEFPAVFLVGLEQGVFPHGRSLKDASQLEEERRLAYVAITRAREHLALSFAHQRWFLGQRQVNSPSQFLDDLPKELLRPVFSGASLSRPAVPQKGDHRPRPSSSEVWVDRSYDQSYEDDDSGSGPRFRVGMQVRHARFGVGEIRLVTGAPPHVNLTIYFPGTGPRTIRSQFVEPA
ncbi:MAG: UvrD-helicase domain-containing protein [Deltaproteobacteria bacterium]|nr:UvrD-helicase domain-containing protein [Deltaproteobacteria bacterium]